LPLIVVGEKTVSWLAHIYSMLYEYIEAKRRGLAKSKKAASLAKNQRPLDASHFFGKSRFLSQRVGPRKGA